MAIADKLVLQRQRHLKWTSFDKLAKELGPHAEKIKNLIRAIN